MFFYGEIWLIIHKLSLLPLLTWSTDKWEQGKHGLSSKVIVLYDLPKDQIQQPVDLRGLWSLCKRSISPGESNWSEE